ncbi:outer membrane protein assembly factor BamE, partial [Xanthomonas perforans]
MRNLLLVAAIALSTAGCGIIYKQPIYQGNLIKQNAVEQLQVGQSKQQVSALLGTPSIPDPFHAQRWDYTSTQRVDRLARTEIKNFT